MKPVSTMLEEISKVQGKYPGLFINLTRDKEMNTIRVQGEYYEGNDSVYYIEEYIAIDSTFSAFETVLQKITSGTENYIGGKRNV